MSTKLRRGLSSRTRCLLKSRTTSTNIVILDELSGSGTYRRRRGEVVSRIGHSLRHVKYAEEVRGRIVTGS